MYSKLSFKLLFDLGSSKKNRQNSNSKEEEGRVVSKIKQDLITAK